ncbi:MAG: ATP-binding protein [Magnetospiraceae bacterium]
MRLTDVPGGFDIPLNTMFDVVYMKALNHTGYAAGKAIRSLGTVQDITDQIIAEQERIQSEIRFRTIIETAVDAILAIDGHGTIITVNPAKLNAGAIGGAGIGLSISRRIMEVLGGQIGVDSEDGVGSRFWIDLPLAKDQASFPTVGNESA